MSIEYFGFNHSGFPFISETGIQGRELITKRLHIDHIHPQTILESSIKKNFCNLSLTFVNEIENS